MGGISTSWLVYTYSRCSLSEEGISHRGPPILVVLVLGLHIDLVQLENEATL